MAITTSDIMEKAERKAKEMKHRVHYRCQDISCCANCAHESHGPEDAMDCDVINVTPGWNVCNISELGICDKYKGR